MRHHFGAWHGQNGILWWNDDQSLDHYNQLNFTVQVEIEESTGKPTDDTQEIIQKNKDKTPHESRQETI